MNKEDYAVVEFVYETVDNQPLVQEVPVRWLSDDNKMCWWPPKNPYKEIKMATEPDVTLWHKHDVRVRKVYADMNEARQKCLVPSDFEEEEMGKHRRKKKETYKHMFRDISHSPSPQPPSSCAEKGDSENFCSSNNACMLSSFSNDVPELINLTTVICPSSGSLGTELIHENSRDSLERAQCSQALPSKPANLYTSHSPPSQPLSSCSEKCGSENSIGSSNAYMNYIPTSLNNNVPELTNLTNMIRPSSRSLTTVLMHQNSQYSLERPQFSRAVPSKPANLSNNASIDEINFSLKALTDEIVSMRKQMQEVILHVVNIEEILNMKLKGKSEVNKRFRDIFPLKTEDSLKELCFTLDREPQLVEDLKFYFNGIGGSGPKDHHGRIFKSIFSNELGMKCSWKGQRGNIRLENVNFIGTCMYVLKQNWRTTDKEFEIFSQDWLRHCSQRKKREEAKNI